MTPNQIITYFIFYPNLSQIGFCFPDGDRKDLQRYGSVSLHRRRFTRTKAIPNPRSKPDRPGSVRKHRTSSRQRAVAYKDGSTCAVHLHHYSNEAIGGRSNKPGQQATLLDRPTATKIKKLLSQAIQERL